LYPAKVRHQNKNRGARKIHYYLQNVPNLIAGYPFIDEIHGKMSPVLGSYGGSKESDEHAQVPGYFVHPDEAEPQGISADHLGRGQERE